MGMKRFWEIFVRKGLKTRTLEEMLMDHAAKEEPGELKRVLGWFDLLMFGVGTIIGAGVFVLTGVAARNDAGPAVVMSYGIASLAAMLAALCYSEFAAAIPISGSAYNYIGMTYGEFMGWIAAINLAAEYALAASAIAKGFTSYFASIIGQKHGFLTIPISDIFEIDLLSFVIIVLLSLVLIWGIKQSSRVQNCIAMVNLITILVVLGATFPFFNSANMSPFIPKEFGYRGVFHAASVVFFSYLGFDTVATAAEEVKNPKKDVPIGIVGSIFISGFLFMAMALGIVGMRRYDLIDLHAPFTEAFNFHGLKALSTIIGIGALTGIVSSLQMCLYSMARVFMVLGRDRLLPSSLAKINEKTHTPVNATIVTIIVTGLPAVFLDMKLLAVMVSMGALSVMSLVCGGILTKSYRPPSDSSQSSVYHDVLLVVLFLSALAEGVLSEWGVPIYVIAVPLGVWLLGTIGFCFLPCVKVEGKFSVPLKPFIPSMGILTTIHLICSLQWPAYVRFVVWQVIGIIVYLAYGMHNSLELGGPSEPLLASTPA